MCFQSEGFTATAVVLTSMRPSRNFGGGESMMAACPRPWIIMAFIASGISVAILSSFAFEDFKFSFNVFNKSNSKRIVSIFRATQRVCWLCQLWRSCFQGLSRRKRSPPYEPRSAMRAIPKVDFMSQRIKFRESRCESSSNTDRYRKSMPTRTSSDRERGTARLHYSLVRITSSLKTEIVLPVYIAVRLSRITST